MADRVPQCTCTLSSFSLSFLPQKEEREQANPGDSSALFRTVTRFLVLFASFSLLSLPLPPKCERQRVLSPHICTMPPRSSLTSSFSVTDANNEVVCPLKNNDGSNCRKRCLGVSLLFPPPFQPHLLSPSARPQCGNSLRTTGKIKKTCYAYPGSVFKSV